MCNKVNYCLLSGINMYELFFVRKGHCSKFEEHYSKTCTCTLIKGKYNVIVNTLSYWDRWSVLKGLYNIIILNYHLFIVIL